MKFLFALFLFAFPVLAFSQNAQTDLSKKAVVYFYAPSAVTTIVRVEKPVFLDDKEIADIRPERYFIVLLDPGKHSFRMKNKKLGGVEMNFEAGKTYYIKVSWATGNIVRPVGLSRVEPESGEYDIKQLDPVKESNIKAKLFVFTRLL